VADSRIRHEGADYDTHSSFFVSRDDKYETWEIVTTIKPSAQGGRPAQWQEHGQRVGDQIVVKRTGPDGNLPMQKGERPKDAYLSQVHVQLMGQLLAGRDQPTMGFHAYYPNTGKMTFRTVRAERQEKGSSQVFVRPTHDQAPEIWHFDADGTLVKRVLGGGKQLLPTTAARVRGRWGPTPAAR